MSASLFSTLAVARKGHKPPFFHGMRAALCGVQLPTSRPKHATDASLAALCLLQFSEPSSA
jgi:hypothetical protein